MYSRGAVLLCITLDDGEAESGGYPPETEPRSGDVVNKHIKARKTHHHTHAIDKEFKELYNMADIEYDDRDMA